MHKIKNSEKIYKAVKESTFKRIYIFSGKALLVIGINPEENMNKYIN